MISNGSSSNDSCPTKNRSAGVLVNLFSSCCSNKSLTNANFQNFIRLEALDLLFRPVHGRRLPGRRANQPGGTKQRVLWRAVAQGISSCFRVVCGHGPVPGIKNRLTRFEVRRCFGKVKAKLPKRGGAVWLGLLGLFCDHLVHHFADYRDSHSFCQAVSENSSKRPCGQFPPKNNFRLDSQKKK